MFGYGDTSSLPRIDQTAEIQRCEEGSILEALRDIVEFVLKRLLDLLPGRGRVDLSWIWTKQRDICTAVEVFPVQSPGVIFGPCRSFPLAVTTRSVGTRDLLAFSIGM